MFGVVLEDFAQCILRQVFGVMCFQDRGVLQRGVLSHKNELVDVQGEIVGAGQIHQFANFGAGIRQSNGADKQRVLANVPAALLECCAYGVSGENLRMFVVIPIVELFFELNNCIRAAGGCVAIIAAQAGAPQARFACQVVDAITAESTLDSFAVEDNGFGCAGA